MISANFLKFGFNRAISKFKLSLYLWLIMFIISLIIIVPVSYEVRANLGHLAWTEKPLLPFELNLIEIFLANQNLLASYSVFIIIMLLFSALLSVFLSGGLFGQMLSPEARVSFRDFLVDGCRHFWQFLLSLIIFIPFLLIFFLVFRLLSAPLKLWSARAVTEWPVILASWLTVLLLALLWTAFRLVLDLVRIFVVGESKRAMAAYLSTLRFLHRHFFRLWSLYLLIGLAVILISAGWLLLVKLLSPASPAGLLIIIILSQAYILFRLLARQVLIGVEASYFSARKGS